MLRATPRQAARSVFFLVVSILAFSSPSPSRGQDQPIGQLYAPPLVLIQRESPAHPGLMNQAEALDINGDGRDDAVFSGQNQDDPEAETPIYLMTATESGNLVMSTSDLVEGGIPVTERGFRQAIPADFNGDGHLDLFLESHGGEPDCGGGVECWTGGANALLLSNASGKLVNVTATHLPTHSDFTHGSSVLDFDGDGDLDIWVNNLGGSPLYNPEFSYLLENDGQGMFSVAADASNPPWQTPIVGRNGILPESGDINGFWSFAVDAENDGDVDLGLGWVTEFSRNVVLLNDGSGSFDMPETGSFPSPDSYLGDRIQHALVKDITGDGLDDVLLHQSRTDFTDPALQLLISNGDGTFRDETDARHPAGPVNSLSDFQLHDLDNDGHLDLFSNIDFARAEVRINDGEGFFRPLAEDWLLGLDWNWIVLDVDGDGGTDFLADQWYGLTLHKMTAPYGPNLHGTEADDRLVGGAHDNVFSGLAGNDLLDGGLGNDWLIGGAGDDMLIGGKGEDGYGLLLADTSDRDEIIEKLGVDRLRFVGFGLDQVAQVSNSGPGDLLISFASGGSVLVRNHFSSEDHRIEWLQTDDRLYRISDDSSFQTGEIGELISDDVIFLGGFEGTLSPIPPEFVPDSTPPLVMPLTGAH